MANFHGVTGGVYKARERIHRGMRIYADSRFQLHALELQSAIRTEVSFKDLLNLAVLLPVVDTIVARV